MFVFFGLAAVIAAAAAQGGAGHLCTAHHYCNDDSIVVSTDPVVYATVSFYCAEGADFEG
jgi:hypothetical protein